MDPARPDLLAALLAPYLFGALAAVLAGGRPLGIWLAHLAAVAGGLAGTLVATGALRAGVPMFLGTFPLTPHAGLSFRLDALGAYFLLVCSLVVVAVSIYAIGYVLGDGRSPARLGLAYNGFLAALVLVLVADSIAAFLVVWEAMSLASFLLVVHDHEHEETRRAGYVYLVMTQAGTAFLVVALLVLAGNAGSLEYGAIRAAAPTLPAAIRDVVFLLVLIGFGTKAGLIPLHVWLPRAHPAAPSHASALMSGLMIKTGVFGLLRVGWELAGPGPAWWGGLVIALGVVSAVLGRPLRADGARPQAAPGLLQHRERRRDLRRRRSRTAPSERGPARGRRAGAGGGAPAPVQPRRHEGRAVHGGRLRPVAPRRGRNRLLRRDGPAHAVDDGRVRTGRPQPDRHPPQRRLRVQVVPDPGRARARLVAARDPD
ncbi:MAG: hypothetical protein HY329_26455, partial [Chloroflexi bacterium]|nr:hypothetical protein [Chloroflexota bacterium]